MMIHSVKTLNQQITPQLPSVKMASTPKVPCKTSMIVKQDTKSNYESKEKKLLDQKTTVSTSTVNLSPGKSVEKSVSKSSLSSNFTDSTTRVQIQHYLHTVSGQLKKQIIQEMEHNYAKPCHIHPDPQIHAHAAKFLFMKHFPQHLTKLSYHQQDDDEVDIISYEDTKKIPFLTPKPPSVPIKVDEGTAEIDSSITDSWTCEKNKLWTRATKIIYSDRMARLSFEGNANEVLLKRNLQDHTANKLRELFGSIFWDLKLLTWLHETLLEHLNPIYQSVYIESLHILRQKIPSLIEKFYQAKAENKNKPTLNDPLFNTLSHYKPKKLPRKPIFILVPSGPNQNVNQTTSPRLKYWSSLLSSMGKLITLTVPAKPTDYISDILADIRCFVNDKIKNCKNSFTNRPIILVGFNSGSVIAAHCALQNPKSVCAVVCLGFPLKTINGSRGELGDTLLEMTSPIQFVIGENSVMTSLDDIEDFRERMTRTETSLIVVGGADDKLVVSNVKKRIECLTQSMVDRCIADEIYSFLSPILLNYSDESSSFNNQINNDPRLFKFCHDHHGQFISSSITQKKRSSSRKRSKSDFNPLDPNDPGASLNSTTNANSNEKSPIFKRKRPPRPKKDPIANNDVNKTTNNIQSNFSQVIGSGPSFTLVPFQSQVSSNLATIIQNSDNSDKPMFTTIKIEKSKIISIDNQPIMPLTSITKKFVKKTVSQSPTTQSVNNANLIHLKNVITNIKTEESNPTSTDSSPISYQSSIQTNKEMKTLIPTGLSSSSISNSKINSISLSLAAPIKNLINASSTTVNSLSASSLDHKISNAISSTTTNLISEQASFVQSPSHITISTTTHLASSTRTGRQIKPPKALGF